MSVLLSNITFLLLPFLKNSYYLKNQLDSESHIVDNKLHTLEKLSNINDLRVMFDNNLTFDNYILFPVFFIWYRCMGCWRDHLWQMFWQWVSGLSFL